MRYFDLVGARESGSPGKSFSHALIGVSCIPPSRPFGGRRRSNILRSPDMTTNAVPRLSGRGFFGLRAGNDRSKPSFFAAHDLTHGQDSQVGDFGVQIVAPRSIIACAKSPARACGARASATFFNTGFAAGSFSRTAKSLASTRSMLPSTGAAGIPKPIAAIAAAV